MLKYNLIKLDRTKVFALYFVVAALLILPVSNGYFLSISPWVILFYLMYLGLKCYAPWMPDEYSLSVNTDDDGKFSLTATTVRKTETIYKKTKVYLGGNGMSEVNKCLPFGLAIEAMKDGKFVARKGWNGNGIFVGIYDPAVVNPTTLMTQQFVFIDTTRLVTNNPDAPKGIVPWQASQTDMLAEDWFVATDDTLDTDSEV